MGNDWNDEQRLAIETKGRDILVAAAAGSGKTTVLVERIRRLVVDEGVPASSLLVVTFTNAAAREMRERIRASLEAALRSPETDKKHRERLRDQLRDLPYAHISTFHAFAISVIRRFFHLVDIEPGFAVCDESKAALMKQDALEELMEREYEAGRPEFLALLDKYTSGREDMSLRALISDKKGLYEQMMSLPDPWGWAEKAVDVLQISKRPLKDSPVWKSYRQKLADLIRKAAVHESSAVELLREYKLPRIADDIALKELGPVSHALDLVSDPLKDDPLKLTDILRKIFAEQKNSRVSGTKDEKPVLDEIKERLDIYRNAAKDCIKEIKAYLDEPLDEAVSAIESTAADAAEFFRLTREFAEIYSDIKAEEKVLDFSDLEHYCLRILEDEEACEALRREISYIFIDEYQDTNALQETIISRIARPGCTFMVGDVKQSIYRFRLADPDIFMEKYRSFVPAGRMDETDGPVVIDMNRNYRSKAPIRNYINDVFAGLMEGYDDRAALHGPEDEEKAAAQAGGLLTVAQAGEPGDEPLLALLDVGEVRDLTYLPDDFIVQDADELAELRDVELEAHHVASIIRAEAGRMFRPGKEGGKARPLRLSDIAILLRANEPARAFRKVLNESGIRCVVSEDDGYFDTIEIEVFMALLSVLDNRQQDVPLITVLHSEIFGFSAEDLAKIRIACPAGSYFKAFAAYGTGGPDTELREKCAGALALIDDWRRLSRVMPLADFVWKLMLDSGYYLLTGAMPDGARRQANMRMLCDKAEAYAAEGEASLYGFTRYVEALRSGKIKIPEANLQSTKEDAVRIMTMHKSKGLEFPMVIVTGLGKRLTYVTGGKMIFHKDMGIGLRCYDEFGTEKGKAYRSTLFQKLMLDRMKREEIAEQIRILYVAMTRARDKLYLTGTVKDAEKFADRVNTDVRGTASYLDMISPHIKYRLFSLKKGAYTPEDGLEIADVSEPGSAACSGTGGPEEPASGSGGTSAAPGTQASRPLTDEERDDLLRQLNYVYPYEEARSIRSKYSVTEINAMTAGSLEGSGQDDSAGSGEGRLRLSVPNFAAGTHKMTAAERGTVYHALMEKIDFRKVDTGTFDTARAQIREMMDSFLEDGLFSREETEAVDPGKMAGFFTSELGRRAVKADREGRLEKEHAFTMKLAARGEEVLVQGIIDCYFTEELEGKTHTVLVDYKSNFFDLSKPEEEEKRLQTAYAGQMALYRQALEKAGLPPVREAYLYLLAVGRLIDMSGTGGFSL